MAHERYQREIEEILDQVNEEAPAATKSRRGPRRATSEARPGPARLRPAFDFSSGRLFLIGAVLLVAAGVLLAFGFGFAAPLAWVGIGLFVVAYIRFFTKPRRTVDRMWRGQSIEDPPSPSAPARWWRWITGG